jgi:serine/threonine protein kinase
VKLLDFGLAKAFNDPSEAGSSDPADSPTIAPEATVAGTLLSTGAYMAPEQAKGRRVDRPGRYLGLGRSALRTLDGRASRWWSGVVFVDLSLAQIAALGTTIAVLYARHRAVSGIASRIMYTPINLEFGCWPFHWKEIVTWRVFRRSAPTA